MQPLAGVVSMIFGGVVTFAFGAWSEPLTFLLVLMAIDYVTGVVASIKDGTGLNSTVGFWGLFRKGLVLLVILLAHRVDVLLGVDVAMGAAVYFYIVNELLSVIENYGRIGLPLPETLKQIVEVLRDRAEQKGQNTKSKK